MAPRVAIVAGLVWCGLAMLLHGFWGATACGTDTAYCAHTRDKNGVYDGVLVDARGATLANTRFSVEFDSIRGRAGGFSSDAQGRYCIVWAQERTTPLPYADGPLGRITTPWRPLGAGPAPARCRAGDREIPWDRASDLTASPRFRAVVASSLLAIVVLLAALLRPADGRLRNAGATLTAATTVLLALVWTV